MRAARAALWLILSGCGPESPLPGTWRYELETAVSTPSGSMVKKVTFDLELAASSSADLLVWRVGGGCNVANSVVGKVATLGPTPPLCGLSAGARISFLEATGSTVAEGDQLAVKAARFEVLDDGRLGTSFEAKLHTNLKDVRVGPVVSIATTGATHGTRVR